ncbi:hypothetical protein AB4Z48_31900 [Cupriavidus sp. 2TAF22]|uniref:hypothetical protein n=1 Tax=unclassified Cupriavidus TaxID=2640874 RepID=UPI003F9246E7
MYVISIPGSALIARSHPRHARAARFIVAAANTVALGCRADQSGRILPALVSGEVCVAFAIDALSIDYTVDSSTPACTRDLQKLIHHNVM